MLYRSLIIAVAAAGLLSLGGCGTIEEVQAPDNIAGAGTHRLTFTSNMSNTVSANSAITPYYALQMSRKATDLCPDGFEKLREGQIVPPDGDSYSYWDIRCTAAK